MLAAGLEGIREEVDPGDPTDDLSYDAKVETMPRTLTEAVAAFEKDPLVAKTFHERFVAEYVEMKTLEWERTQIEVTESERNAYLMNI